MQKIRNKLLIILGLTVSAFAFSPVAMASNDEILINCDNCNNPMAAVLNAKAPLVDAYTAHVLDFTKNKITSYKVSQPFGEFRGRNRGPRIRKIPTNRNINADFLKLVSVKNGYIREASKLDIPENIAATPWDIYASNSARNDFLNYVYNNASIGMRSVNLINFVTSVFRQVGLNIQIPLSIKVGKGEIILVVKLIKFDNGQFEVDYEIDWENSLDEDGNPIVVAPTTPSQGNLNFSGGSRAFTGFVSALSRAGFTLKYNGNNSGGGSVSCVLKSGNVVVCTYVRH